MENVESNSFINPPSSTNRMAMIKLKLNAMFSCQKVITVEPVLFLYNIASQIVYITSQDLMLQKSCEVNLKYPSFVCDDLNEYKSVEDASQYLVSSFLTWRSIFETSIKIVSVPLLGWWGDRWGYKWPLIFCLTALGLESASLLVNSLFQNWPLEAILFGSVFFGISGGPHGLLMLSFSFMAQRTTTEKRTLRIGILDGFYYLGSPIGLAIAPRLFDSVGYNGIFSISVGLYALSVAYVALKLSTREYSNLSEEEEEEEERRGYCNDCGVERLSDAFYTTFKQRPEKKRRFILVCILAMLLDSFVIWGESNVKYMFTKKALDWDYTQYSHYGTASSLFTVIGALVIVPIITMKTDLKDAAIGLLGSLCRASERIVYSFATSPSEGWLMYLGSIISVGTPLCPIAIRSLISKLAIEDVGQVFAVMAVGESLLPFVTAPVYNSIYQSTLDHYPGAFYVVSVAVNICMALCFVYLLVAMRPSSPRPVPIENEENSESDRDER